MNEDQTNQIEMNYKSFKSFNYSGFRKQDKSQAPIRNFY